MMKLDISQLEGWMIKRHSSNKSMFSLSSENKRWFKVREVKGIEETELTLAYYASHRTKEAKGFIYLRDVTSIHATEDLSITIKSPARVMTVVTETLSEHSFWLEGLAHLCCNAETTVGPNVVLQYKYNKPIIYADEKPVRNALDDKNDFARIDPEIKSTIDVNTLNGNQNKGAISVREKDPEPIESSVSKIDKSDYRSSGYRTGASSAATTRLHGHIRKDSELYTASSRHNSIDLQADAKETSRRNVSDYDDINVASNFQRFNESESRVLENSSSSSFIDDKDTPNINDLENVDIAVNQRVKSEFNKDKKAPLAELERGQQEKKSFENQITANRSANVTNDEVNATQKQLRKASDDAVDTLKPKRSSIDDILIAPIRTQYDSEDEKISGNDVDLSKEKRFYEQAKALRDKEEKSEEKASARSRSNSLMEQHLIERESKHPRPPLQSPPSYAQQVSGVVKSHAVLAESQVNVIADKLQIPCDKDFVEDNWDPDTADQVNSKCVLTNNIQKSQAFIASGVRADENWLEDDFDS